jgi:hypothetical protein
VARGAEARATPSALPTVVVLPDTQYYASAFPEVLAAQTRWIAGQQAPRSIAAVLQLGDIVDSANDEAQWHRENPAWNPRIGLSAPQWQGSR